MFCVSRRRTGIDRREVERATRPDYDMSLGTYWNKIKKDGIESEVLDTIASLSYAGYDIIDMVDFLQKRFPYHLRNLRAETFEKWLATIPSIAKAYSFSREASRGKLLKLAMRKAEKSIDYPKDDFILKLLDRIEAKQPEPKDDIDMEESKELRMVSELSSQSRGTISKIVTEASRFGGLDSIKEDDIDESQM